MNILINSAFIYKEGTSLPIAVSIWEFFVTFVIFSAILVASELISTHWKSEYEKMKKKYERLKKRVK